MLTQESLSKLWNLFEFRKVPYRGKKHTVRKYAIPIGVNELSVRKVDEGTTRNGKRMVILTIWREPEESPYNFSIKDKMSFAPIICYHVEGSGSIKTFYKSFSTMPAEDLAKLKKFQGKKFLGLIKHVQKELVKDGQLVRNPNGNKVVYWQQEIVKVAKLGEQISFNYFDLVERVENDTRLTDEFIISLNR